MADAPSVTDVFLRAEAGEPDALSAISPLIYEHMREMAHRQLRREPDGHTLATTELVHEAYVRLIDPTRVRWSGRAHFMALAATAMRRVLVDHARKFHSAKRGGGRLPVSIDSVELAAPERAELILALDEALERLRQLEPRQAQVIDCRFFGGMTEEETAEAVGVGLRTAKRDWAKARSWLYDQIRPDAPS